MIISSSGLRFTLAALLLLATASLAPSFAASNTGKVHGVVFNDPNKNGVQDDTETRAAGQEVRIYRMEANGTRTLVQTTQTDANGEYDFAGLPFGQYVVEYVFSTGITVESLPLTVSPDDPNLVTRSTPVLSASGGYSFSLLNLGLRNPANVIGNDVSRFAPRS